MMNNMDESITTLRFASTAKKIKNKARINEDSKETLLRKFQQQIELLRKQLETAEQEDGEEGKESDSFTTFWRWKTSLFTNSSILCSFQVQKVVKETNQA